MHSQVVSQFVEAVNTFGTKTAVVDWPDGVSERRTSFDALMQRARQEGACRRDGVAANALATAAYMLLLGACSGKRDVAISTVFKGLQSPKLLNTVGLITRHIPLRAVWSEDMPCGEYVHNVSQMALGSMTYSMVDPDDIKQIMGACPKLEFLYQGDIRNNISIGGHVLTEKYVPMEPTAGWPQSCTSTFTPNGNRTACR